MIDKTMLVKFKLNKKRLFSFLLFRPLSGAAVGLLVFYKWKNVTIHEHITISSQIPCASYVNQKFCEWTKCYVSK